MIIKNIIKVIFLSFVLIIPASLFAKEFIVSNTSELRAAIQEGNNNNEDDIININAGIYPLNGASDEDGSLIGDLDITSNIILNGADARSTIIMSDGNDRVLQIIGGIIVSLNNLTLEGGRLSKDSGAGIFLSGNGFLTIKNCIITNNITTGSTGPRVGGIHNEDGKLNINNSLIFDNHSPDGVGGGIFQFDGALEVINTTVSGNSSGRTGGGIEIAGGAALILNSTITQNESNVGGEGVEVSAINLLTMGNSIVAGNTSPPNLRADLREHYTSLGGNIIGNNGEMKPIKFLTVIDQKPSDQIGFADDPIDPMLGPLQNNGGPTDTYALLPGSPALNAGEESQCLDEDQRGVVRPLGGQCDIGAFEVGCGDGTKEANEACDDGNNVDGDGCSSICKLESTNGGGSNNNNAASAGGCGQLNPGPTNGLQYGIVLLAVWVGILGILRKKRSY